MWAGVGNQSIDLLDDLLRLVGEDFGIPLPF
jgi:hypothetical protein